VWLGGSEKPLQLEVSLTGHARLKNICQPDRQKGALFQPTLKGDSPFNARILEFKDAVDIAHPSIIRPSSEHVGVVEERYYDVKCCRLWLVVVRASLTRSRLYS
jgi:sarcosine oxidase delta subunit